MSAIKKYTAEGLGTFALVLFGCGAATIAGVSATGPSGLGLLGISLAFGLAVVAMAYTIGPISGCHINPAISVAMCVAGKLSVKDLFTAEFVFTFLFLMVIFGTTAKKASPQMAGLAIGISLALIHFVAIPITGTSVNPARSLGPALFAGGIALQQLWLFIVAPLAGGIFAALLRKVFVDD